MRSKRHHRTELVHKSKKKLDEVRSEINVTPLVDVCLVLLIIFMVVAPMLSRGKDVKLPEASSPEARSDNPEQPIVSILWDEASKKRRVFLNQDEMKDLGELKDRLREALKHMKKDSKHVAFLKAGKNTPYAEVYPVLIAIHEADSRGVELGTNPDRNKGGE
jgi:biopolymer transport protein ExbD